MKEIVLVGVKVQVRPLPASKTVRIIAYQTSKENRLSACAAAVGLAWPDDDEARTWGAMGDSVVEFGDTVVDALMARGAAVRDIYDAGREILALSTGGLKFTSKDVTRVVDFTGAPAKA